MIGRIIVGLIVVGLGYAMVSKTNWFYDILGSVSFMERHVGYGSSRFFYKMLGLAVVIVGALIVTNLFDVVVGSAIRSLFAR
jgi:hypothetical protein